ncbi:MAG: 6-methylsalicylate decarboxylase [Alphaproteobacteria bacterium]|jgi:predicted TIM-barrel fold metal-dependent hydrolase|nr:6-methylsalicylate decarboxylase [Alphaproteobacteria bacterium]
MWCEPVERTSSPHDCPPALCGCSTRRSFLKSVSAVGAGALLPAPTLWAQPTTPATRPHRIDVHHHYYPADLQEAWQKANVRNAPVVQRWTLADTLDQMDKGGVATSMLSLPTGINLPNLSADDRLSWTRRVNDYAAKARADHAGRFGVFGFLPMPDIDAALKGIEYALDVMKADGIGLNTSYGDKWLGDPAFKPVMDELNRRKTVVFVHPLGPACCNTLMSYVPASFAEYPQDTNRTVMSLLFSGTFTRTRDVRWIFCHAGAAVPLLAGRVKSLAKIQLQNTAASLPDGIDFELQRLFYETANAAFAPNLAALLKYVAISQVMFGSDYPYVSVTENAADLVKAGLSAADLKAVEYENAIKLFPRLKA